MDPVVETPVANAAPAATPAPDAGANIDLSSYFVEGNPGTFDQNKIIDLVKERDVKDKSARYFQSQFMQKSGASDNIEDYFKDFKPDSSYADLWDADITTLDEKTKELHEAMHNDLNGFKKFAHENKISTRDAHLMFEYYMQEQAKLGLFNRPTQEQIKLSEDQRNQEIESYNSTLMKSLNRSKLDNDNMLEGFLNSQNIMTTNPEIKDYLKGLMKDPKGYAALTMMSQAINHQGIPVVSGTVQGKDSAALMAALSKEPNPELREKLMRDFYGEN